MIRVVEIGRNPTMRYLARTRGISVAWLHEVFQRDDVPLEYEKSDRMAADIFTKAFTDADKWKSACGLIGVCDPAELSLFGAKYMETTEDPPQSGGHHPSKVSPIATSDCSDDGATSGSTSGQNIRFSVTTSGSKKKREKGV